VEDVEAVLGEYAQSGLTQRVFAQTVGIGVSTLQYWLRREARRGTQKQRCESGSAWTSKEVSLLEVELSGKASPRGEGDGSYAIEWSDGMRLRVPRGFRDEEIQRLLGILKEGR
jgi:hypothetical protein